MGHLDLIRPGSNGIASISIKQLRVNVMQGSGGLALILGVKNNTASIDLLQPLILSINI